MFIHCFIFTNCFIFMNCLIFINCFVFLRLNARACLRKTLSGTRAAWLPPNPQTSPQQRLSGRRLEPQKWKKSLAAAALSDDGPRSRRSH